MINLLTKCAVVVFNTAVMIIFTNYAYAKQSEITIFEPIIVTATKEQKVKSNVAGSIAVIGGNDIKAVSPSHPSEILNRISGVHINNLSGEGHMTSIRQPITTGGVYLFLEDGLPTRPTGFFNHNGLYEINVPQSDRLEIIKGPGSALYGSDSIGGIINSITKAPPEEREIEVNPEYGSYGWKRLLFSGGGDIHPNHGVRIDLNLTDNGGYRDESSYSRYTTTGRLDSIVGGDILVKTIISYSQIDQSGVSGLEGKDYYVNPRKNLFHGDIGGRKVNSLRLSSEISYESDDMDLYTIIPFFRNNHMSLMPSWMIRYDPNIRDYNFKSYGILTKYRHEFNESNGEIIIGADVDYTPSSYLEKDINVTRISDIFNDFSYTGDIHYDFKSNQTSISPYLHSEMQISPKTRLVGGVRYDHFNIKYKNKLSTLTAGRHVRAASQDISYDHFSPKLGVIHKYIKHHNVYANYHHAFRIAAAGQLFRSGSSVNTTELKPVKNDSFEIGLRGKFNNKVDYDLAIYHMEIKDDIVSIVDATDRKVQNAGETRHQGIEIALNVPVTQEWNLRTSWSYTNQKYKNFEAVIGFPSRTINYTGYDIGKAPKKIGNLTLEYHPKFLKKVKLELEWEHLGGYFTDETNTLKYGGHDLFNVRAHYNINNRTEIYTRFGNASSFV